MKSSFIAFFLVLLLFACKESIQKIEVLEDYDKIYLTKSQVTVPSVPVDSSFNDVMKGAFKNVVRKLEQEKGTVSTVYPFGYRLYVSEDGNVEKIKSIEIDIPNIPDTKVFSQQNEITKLLVPEIEKWKFVPAKLSDNRVKYRTDIKVYVLNSNGKLTIELADKIVDMGNFSMDFAEEDYFVKVEEMPSIIGGLKSIQEKIIYPEIAKRAGIEGKVFIVAFIGENGEVDNARVLKGIGGGCDESALNAVLKTKFTPGKQGGKPVKVQVSIPIVFKLN